MSCEKCWHDAHRGPQFSVAEEYSRLIHERDCTGHVCTPEQQAGPDAGWCPTCQRRMVLRADLAWAVAEIRTLRARVERMREAGEALDSVVDAIPHPTLVMQQILANWRAAVEGT